MEKTNVVKRSENWFKIYEVVNTLPTFLIKGNNDTPDVPSVTTSIEELFLKLLPIHAVGRSEQFSLADMKDAWDNGIYTESCNPIGTFDDFISQR